MNSINLLTNYPSIRHCFIKSCDVDIDLFSSKINEDNTSRILAIVTQFLLIVLKQAFYRSVRRLDISSVIKNPQAADFTLIVNVPGYKSEHNIKDELEALLSLKGVNVEVVKVNKVYDIQKYYDCAKKVMIAQKNIKRLRVLGKEDDPKFRRFSAQSMRNMKLLEQINSEFNTVEGKRAHFANKAFVSFATISQRIEAERILSRFYGLSFCRTSGYSGVQAQSPMSYQWENFGQNWVGKNILRLTTSIVAIVMIFISFVLILLLKNLQARSQEVNDSFVNVLISFAISTVISIVNISIIVTTKLLVKKEKRTLYSSAALSAAFKIFFSLFVNSGLTIMIASFINFADWKMSIFSSYGTVPNIMLFIIINSFLNPLLFIFDITWIIRMIQRRRLLNIFKNVNSRNPYVQCEVNEVFENSEFLIEEGYYFFFQTMGIVLFYSFLVPYALLFGILEFFLMYWVHKWRLVKRSIVSREYDFNFSIQMGMMFDICILIFAIGAVAFHASFRQTKAWFVALMIIFGGFDVIMAAFSTTLRLCLKLKRRKGSSEIQYVNQWMFFVSDYDRRNPLTALSAYNDWISALKCVDPSAPVKTEKKAIKDPRETIIQYVQDENRFGKGGKNIYVDNAANVVESLPNTSPQENHQVNLFTASKEANEKLRVFQNKKNLECLEAHPPKFNLKEFPSMLMPKVFCKVEEPEEPKPCDFADFLDLEVGDTEQKELNHARSLNLFEQMISQKDADDFFNCRATLQNHSGTHSPLKASQSAIMPCRSNFGGSLRENGYDNQVMHSMIRKLSDSDMDNNENEIDMILTPLKSSDSEIREVENEKSFLMEKDLLYRKMIDLKENSEKEIELQANDRAGLSNFKKEIFRNDSDQEKYEPISENNLDNVSVEQNFDLESEKQQVHQESDDEKHSIKKEEKYAEPEPEPKKEDLQTNSEAVKIEMETELEKVEEKPQEKITHPEPQLEKVEDKQETESTDQSTEQDSNFNKLEFTDQKSEIEHQALLQKDDVESPDHHHSSPEDLNVTQADPEKIEDSEFSIKSSLTGDVGKLFKKKKDK